MAGKQDLAQQDDSAAKKKAFLTSEINKARAKIFYKNSVGSAPASLLLATIAFVCLRASGEIASITLWYTVVCSLYLFRLLQIAFYYLRPQYLTFHSCIFSLTNFLTAICWGLLGSVMMPAENNMARMVIIAYMAAMPPAAINSFQGRAADGICFSSILLMPFAAFCFSEQNSYYNALGSVTILYFINLSLSAYQSYRQLIKMLTLNLVLEEAKAAADKANSSKSAFLASMSHELRTPLNAILGYSELIEEELTPLQLSSCVDKIQKVIRATKNLTALINNILDISKVEANKMEIHLEKINIAQLCLDIAAIIEPLAKQKNNQFIYHIENNLPSFTSDLTKIRQSLINLLSNANKFTSAGKLELLINTVERDAALFIQFSVSDTGMGIAADKLDKLFKPFSQTHNDLHPQIGGTGLGLYISQQFCQLLGGDITVASTLGKGSTFTIYLPVTARAALP